jgi:hypothetical protein
MSILSKFTPLQLSRTGSFRFRSKAQIKAGMEGGGRWQHQTLERENADILKWGYHKKIYRIYFNKTEAVSLHHEHVVFGENYVLALQLED